MIPLIIPILQNFGKSSELLKIKLRTELKIDHNWEVSITSSDLEDVLAKIRKADKALRQEYGTPA